MDSRTPESRFAAGLHSHDRISGISARLPWTPVISVRSKQGCSSGIRPEPGHGGCLAWDQSQYDLAWVIQSRSRRDHYLLRERN
jgi:hypothetical protein